jgi:hypothetical protein
MNSNPCDKDRERDDEAVSDFLTRKFDLAYTYTCETGSREDNAIKQPGAYEMRWSGHLDPRLLATQILELLANNAESRSRNVDTTMSGGQASCDCDYQACILDDLITELRATHKQGRWCKMGCCSYCAHCDGDWPCSEFKAADRAEARLKGLTDE